MSNIKRGVEADKILEDLFEKNNQNANQSQTIQQALKNCKINKLDSKKWNQRKAQFSATDIHQLHIPPDETIIFGLSPLQQTMIQ